MRLGPTQKKLLFTLMDGEHSVTHIKSKTGYTYDRAHGALRRLEENYLVRRTYVNNRTYWELTHEGRRTAETLLDSR